MTRTACQRLILALLPALSLAATARAQEARPEFVSVRVGFADRYKVGLWTPIEVTLRGGSSRATGVVRATLADSDGLNCSFESAEPCELPPGQEATAVLYVRFGHEACTIALELIDGQTTLAAKSFAAGPTTAQGQFAPSLRAGQRLIVAVGNGPTGLEKAMPGSQGAAAQNVVATVDSLARLPARWHGYEGIDIVVISTSRPEVWENIKPDDARIEALDQWVRMGGTLVLCAGSQADKALRAGSPLARFVPGRFERTVILRQTSGWETYARSVNPIPPPQPDDKVELPTARLADVQGKIEAHESDLPLVIRRPYGLGQTVFAAADLDTGPIGQWTDRPLLLAALLGLPAGESAATAEEPAQSFGYNDLAGQLRSALDLPRGVRQAPFFAVALLLVGYILLIGPGDYFLLRRLGRGMWWTWITFPAIVVLFAVGAYLASYWLKGDELRVSQVDLVDIDADGTARGASWFNIFSPRGESFDLSMRPLLPDGWPPQEASAALAWFGKAGNEFNGMYGHDAQASVPLGSQGYSIASSLETIRGAPIQVWSSKSFTQRWLGRAPELGIDAALKEEDRQLTGTITNRLKGPGLSSEPAIILTHAFVAYDNWAYDIGTLRPGEPVEIGPTTRRVSISTFLDGETSDDMDGPDAKAEAGFYDRGSRDMAYVLKAMIFYDAAGGRKRTRMANDYQRFTDLSGLLKTGRAILVAVPPQDGSCRGGQLLRGPVPRPGEADTRQPLGSKLDRHATIYRFILPVAQNGSAN